MPYWLNSSFAALPAVVWVIVGLGFPYALAVLPRKDWRDWPLVSACALAIGPALLTAWMCVLGVIGARDETALITAPNILIGTLILALVGVGVVWFKRKPVSPPNPHKTRLLLDARIIAGLIGASLVIVWLTTAFWPFIHYDTLWVYGYQGRLYALEGFIPQDIGYYPPFMALQYTYAQVVSGLMLDDHAARVVIFPLYLGSILMAYALGARLFNRRVGLFAGALWALYPHAAQWSNVGDLEIPQTFAFTGAAMFFISAWMQTERRWRWHYGALAGLFLGIAMWTKPTAGAFILGVILLVGLEGLRVRFDWRRWLPRFEVAVATGLASIPLGAAWYVRNLLLGHEVITLPNDFWLTQSMRSGQEMGWVVLALTLLILFVLTAPLNKRPDRFRLLIGYAIFIAVLTPTIFAPRRMVALEYVGIFIGFAVMLSSLWPYYRLHTSPQTRRALAVLGWVLALAFPYFLNWFWNYSYHFRLSFAIVPLMILPSALILGTWFTAPRVQAFSRRARWLYHGAIVLAGLPAVIVPLYSYTGGWDWLWSNEFPDDFTKLESFNYALAHTVRNLQADIETQEIENPVIVAPGLQRLPFFFPEADVRILDAPTRLEDLRDADYYIYTQEARWYYEELGLPLVNQVTGSMPRPLVMSLVTNHEDSSFFSYIFRLRNVDRRFRAANQMTALDDSVQAGDFAVLAGADLSTTTFDGAAPRLRLHWQVLQPAPQDYSVYVHLRDTGGNVLQTWDDVPLRTPYGYYPTNLWEAGEFVVDVRRLILKNDIPAGEYDLAIGFYDLQTNTRVPFTVNGDMTDGYIFPVKLTVAD